MGERSVTHHFPVDLSPRSKDFVAPGSMSNAVLTHPLAVCKN